MEQILNEDLSKPSFAECLKSGVMLCRCISLSLSAPLVCLLVVRLSLCVCVRVRESELTRSSFRLLNTIKPGLVTNKIHLTKIKYHQMVRAPLRTPLAIIDVFGHPVR